MIKNKSNKKQKGQGLVEYALILVLVAVVVIAVLVILGLNGGLLFAKVNGTMSCVAPETFPGGASPNNNVNLCTDCAQRRGQPIIAADDETFTNWKSKGLLPESLIVQDWLGHGHSSSENLRFGCITH
jgi:pilus assembly protein Flp/PilA